MQQFVGDPKSGYLDLESHHLALAIAKRTLDKNRFKCAQKTTNCTPPNFKVGDRVYFKNKQPGKWYLKWRNGYRMWWGIYWRVLQNICREVQRTPEGPLPPIYDHHNISGHMVSIDNFSIVGREDQNLMRTIKEALYIRVNNPPLNRNIGKYHLPHIWDEVLYNTSELKLK